MHRISEMLDARIGTAEDLLSIRSLLSAGIELGKNRYTMTPIAYADRIWDKQQSIHTWIESHVGDNTAVLLRKVGCCNRSIKGISSFETLTSLFATYVKRGQDFKDWIKERLIGPGPKYVPPTLLPNGLSTKILLNS